MRPARWTVPMLAAAALLVAGCGDDGGEGGGELIIHQGTVGSAPEVEVDAFDFGYSPDPLSIPANETVNLLMHVTSGGHNLRIEGTDFQFPIVEEGDSIVGALTVAEPGDYRMVCTVPGHEAAGMVATLQVG